ncbi:hypothetical protein TYRP_018551 [Tyrophagus putrescentiae]|nr:hypothetical protein TYRP_018551 [Tyrophagus putrescentiae]
MPIHTILLTEPLHSFASISSGVPCSLASSGACISCSSATPSTSTLPIWRHFALSIFSFLLLHLLLGDLVHFRFRLLLFRLVTLRLSVVRFGLHFLGVRGGNFRLPDLDLIFDVAFLLEVDDLEDFEVEPFMEAPMLALESFDVRLPFLSLVRVDPLE